MASSGSVSRWIPGLKAGDDQATEQLWNRYYDKLITLAQRKLESAPCRMADGEDVALDAFAAFCRAARQGRFPRLSDRQDLWRILLKITGDKAVDHIRRESAQVRGGGTVPHRIGNRLRGQHRGIRPGGRQRTDSRVRRDGRRKLPPAHGFARRLGAACGGARQARRPHQSRDRPAAGLRPANRGTPPPTDSEEVAAGRRTVRCARVIALRAFHAAGRQIAGS